MIYFFGSKDQYYGRDHKQKGTVRKPGKAFFPYRPRITKAAWALYFLNHYTMPVKNDEMHPLIMKAHKRLATARKKARAWQKEIKELRNFLLDEGENPDVAKLNLISRNKEIFRKWKKGAHPRQLGKEYNLTAQRIIQICLRIEKILETKKSGFDDYQELLTPL